MITTQGLDLSIEQLPKDKKVKLNRYLKRELKHLKDTVTTNSTYLMPGIDLIKELIIMTRRVGMFAGSDNSTRSKRFKNKIISEINQVDNEQLYSVNRDAFKFHLTTKDEMMEYLKLLIE